MDNTGGVSVPRICAKSVATLASVSFDIERADQVVKATDGVMFVVFWRHSEGRVVHRRLGVEKFRTRYNPDYAIVHQHAWPKLKS